MILFKRLFVAVLAIAVVLLFSSVSLAGHKCPDKNPKAPGHHDPDKKGKRNGHNPDTETTPTVTAKESVRTTTEKNTRNTEPNQWWLLQNDDKMYEGYPVTVFNSKGAGINIVSASLKGYYAFVQGHPYLLARGITWSIPVFVFELEGEKHYMAM